MNSVYLLPFSFYSSYSALQLTQLSLLLASYFSTNSSFGMILMTVEKDGLIMKSMKPSWDAAMFVVSLS